MGTPDPRMKRIYLFDIDKKIGLFHALSTITDEWIDEGNDCPQTIIDLREACIVAIQSLAILDSELYSLIKKASDNKLTKEDLARAKSKLLTQNGRYRCKLDHMPQS